MAPMLGGDLRRNAMAHALFLSLPGVPVLRYGGEIGMGDDLARPERWSVRTPMQWDDSMHGGFSTAPLEQLVACPIDRGFYGYPSINVQAQRRDPRSLFSRVQRMIAAARTAPGMGTDCVPRAVDHDAVFAMCHRVKAGQVLTAVNLAPQRVSFTLPRLEGQPHEILSDGEYGPADDGCLMLEPYGYRWFRYDS